MRFGWLAASELIYVLVCTLDQITALDRIFRQNGQNLESCSCSFYLVLCISSKFRSM